MKSRSSVSNDLLGIEGGDSLHSESLRGEERRVEKADVKGRRMEKLDSK